MKLCTKGINQDVLCKFFVVTRKNHAAFIWNCC